MGKVDSVKVSDYARMISADYLAGVYGFHSPSAICRALSTLLEGEGDSVATVRSFMPDASEGLLDGMIAAAGRVRRGRALEGRQ